MKRKIKLQVDGPKYSVRITPSDSHIVGCVWVEVDDIELSQQIASGNELAGDAVRLVAKYVKPAYMGRVTKFVIALVLYSAAVEEIKLILDPAMIDPIERLPRTAVHPCGHKSPLLEGNKRICPDCLEIRRGAREPN